jgi:hypothetical protein
MNVVREIKRIELAFEEEQLILFISSDLMELLFLIMLMNTFIV